MSFSICHIICLIGLAYLKYCSAQAAAYAKKKFEKVEYPPGYPIAVRFASENPSRYSIKFIELFTLTYCVKLTLILSSGIHLVYIYYLFCFIYSVYIY